MLKPALLIVLLFIVKKCRNSLDVLIRTVTATKRPTKRQYGHILVKSACSCTWRHTIARLIAGQPAGLLYTLLCASFLFKLATCQYMYVQYRSKKGDVSVPCCAVQTAFPSSSVSV